MATYIESKCKVYSAVVHNLGRHVEIVVSIDGSTDFVGSGRVGSLESPFSEFVWSTDDPVTGEYVALEKDYFLRWALEKCCVPFYEKCKLAMKIVKLANKLPKEKPEEKIRVYLSRI